MQKIQEQIAKIIDTGDGDRRKIIVRVGGKDEREKSLVRLAASAISQRNMSLSARDVLPLDKKHTHKTKAPQDQDFPRDAKGVSARIGKTAAVAGGYRTLRSYAFERLDSSLKNDFVDKAAHEVERPKQEDGTVQSFWTSKSMLLDISKDDLTKLPQKMPNVQAVYPNRQLRVPRLVAIKNMPIPIRENKISSWGLQKIGALATWGAWRQGQRDSCRRARYGRRCGPSRPGRKSRALGGIRRRG